MTKEKQEKENGRNTKAKVRDLNSFFFCVKWKS